MQHPIEQEELMAYLDGELAADRASETAAHLGRCGDCRSLAADLRDVSQKLLAWQVEPRAIRHISVAPVRRRWAEIFGFQRRSTWALVFSSVLLLAIAIWSPKRHMDAFQTAQGDQLVTLNAPTAQPSPMIVRTAQLTLTTPEFDKARHGVDDILKRHRGYFGELSVTGSAGSGRTLDATMRVPADQRDSVIAELKNLGRVDSESQGGEDVTSQFVDLEARLSNAKNTEQRLTDVLRERTGKLSDVLAVEQEIGRVRGEIEQMEAQKKTLANRVDFASLTVKVTEDYSDPARTRFRKAAAEGGRVMIGGVMNVGLFLVAYGPSLLLWCGLLYFPTRFAWKKFT